MVLPPAAAALLEQPGDACAWPIGELSRCGRPAADGPYCEAHRHEAHAAQDAPGPLERGVEVTPTLRLGGGLWAVRPYLPSKW